MPFDRIIGQSRALDTLQRMLVSGCIPHALLFAGIAGVGKHTAALALAQALNCAQRSGDFCGTCTSCRKTAAGLHPDIVEIRPEKNTIKIGQIRDLQQSIMFAPVEAAWRVIIIDQAESMNREAANCLLKTLEEPPDATVLILVADTGSRLLPTVVSRCRKIVFGPLAQRDIEAVLLREDTTAEQSAIVAAHAHGSLHRARQLLDDSLMEDFTRLQSAMFEPCSVEQRLELARALGTSPERTPALMILLLEWLRDMLLCVHGTAPQLLFNAGRLERLQHAARHTDPARLQALIDRVMQLIRDRNQTINMRLALESLLLA